MRNDLPSFVAFDLASLVVVSQAGLDRCLDLVLAAREPAPGDADGVQSLRGASARMGEVYDALDRVLVAHVAHDAFVSERPGTRAVFERLLARGVPVLGVASFSRAVAVALARRFRWSELVELEACTRADGAPLYQAVQRAARARGWDAEGGAFVTDDLWELGSAAAAGCARPIAISDPERNMRDLLAHLLVAAPETRGPSGPRDADLRSAGPRRIADWAS